MNRINLIFLTMLASASIFNAEARDQSHPDYVPDMHTAEVIGKAVLTAKFGENEVNKQSPLTVVQGYDGVWIVQGNTSKPIATGGGMAVWIDRNSGCIVNIFAYMK